MTQTAIVTGLLGNRLAEVAVERISACGHSCASCGGGCSERRIVTVKAQDPIGVSVGERVVIRTETRKILSAALLVYMLPLLLLFVAYGLAVSLHLPEPASILVSIAGFLIGAALVVFINRYVRRDKDMGFTIVALADERS